MLHMGNIIYNRIIGISTVCATINNDNDIQKFLKRIKKAVLYTTIDTIIVGGIAFFSSMVAIGYDDLLTNAKIAFISSAVTAGLTFFTEMRSSVTIIHDKERDDEDVT